MYKPASPLHNEVPCNFDDVTSQLLNEHFRNGTVLYDIYAVDTPWVERPHGAPSVKKIGEIRLKTGFVKSTFGDTRLFFQHKFFNRELAAVADPKERAVWKTYAENVDFMKTEGAMLYAPFLN